VGIVYNIMFVVGRQGTEVPAIVKVIESSGMLSWVIQAITVPPNRPDGLPQCPLIIDWFSKCRRLVKKRLASGSPSGDVLIAVLAGHDGHKGTRNPSVMSRLNIIYL